MSQNAGAKDNRAVEARADVLIYTSAVLERDLDVVGAVSAELYITSSLEHTDLFVRLCDVDPRGRSINISDGLPAGAWTATRERRRDVAGHGQAVGHGALLQARPPHPRAGCRWVAPALCAQPRQRRAAGDGHDAALAEHSHGPDHPSAIMLPVSA